MKTKVLFRRDRYGPVAIFPRVDPFTCDMRADPIAYDLRGEGYVPCARSWVQDCTQPATPAEARQLRAALKARGYGALQVLKRWPRGKVITYFTQLSQGGGYYAT